MGRTLDIDPAHCPRCEGPLEPIAIITREDIVEKTLSHVHLPMAPEPVGPGRSLAWELDEPMQDWVVGMDPEPPDVAMTQRGPPCDACVDPSAPDW
jgi:hypothetical protein